MHVNTYRNRQSCIISRPSTLEMFWGTGSSKGLKQATALRWIFAPQFVISQKNTRTGRDCTSNALENTSIKNWLIQWNRAEPGETGKRDSVRISQKNPGDAACRKEETRSGEERLPYPNYFQRLRNAFTLLQNGFSEQNDMERTVRSGTQNLFPACFHPLSVENNDTAWISIFFLFHKRDCCWKLTNFQKFSLCTWDKQITSSAQVECASQVVKPYSNACGKKQNIFIYTIFMATHTKRHTKPFLTGFCFLWITAVFWT